ncbi:MAG: cupin domain-containing protein [Deltaproteobacteria bacterium]|nr:cupin domain-containing protein [Deltaproteobacteria bacterium]
MKIGEKIKSLRQLSSLTQEELAERAELTKGFISQMERDLTSISLDSLIQILDALDIDLSQFFKEMVEERIVFKKEDKIRIKRNGVAAFELLVPGSANRSMEPVKLTLKPGEKTEEEDPHPGEEMGYIIKGKVNIRLGDNSYCAEEGNCFYFTANRVHQILNAGQGEAVVLWITSPPSF